MAFRLQDIFLRYAPAIVLTANLAAPANAQTTEGVPIPEWNPVDCQALDAPLAQSDISQREAAMIELQKKIDRLKASDSTFRALAEVEREKIQLGIFNLLDRFRLSLQDYTDWDELTAKLKRNGIVIDRVCFRGYDTLDLPVVLYENGDGTASLDINSAKLVTKSGDGDHEMKSTMMSKSIEEIAAALEPELINRAIRFTALSGTSPDNAPVLNKSLTIEDLALVLTLWQAQAAAEQVLQAADTFARTGEDKAFDAVKTDYPYLSGLIEDVRTKTIFAAEDGDALSKEDRITFRQLAAQEMLNLPDIRERVYQSLLDEMQDMAGNGLDLNIFFNHEMTAKEMDAAIARLDESFTALPVIEIYNRWRDSEHDPAREIIEQMSLLRAATAGKQQAPAPVFSP